MSVNMAKSCQWLKLTSIMNQLLMVRRQRSCRVRMVCKKQILLDIVGTIIE